MSESQTALHDDLTSHWSWQSPTKDPFADPFTDPLWTWPCESASVPETTENAQNSSFAAQLEPTPSLLGDEDHDRIVFSQLYRKHGSITIQFQQEFNERAKVPKYMSDLHRMHQTISMHYRELNVPVENAVHTQSHNVKRQLFTSADASTADFKRIKSPPSSYVSKEAVSMALPAIPLSVVASGYSTDNIIKQVQTLLTQQINEAHALRLKVEHHIASLNSVHALLSKTIT